MVVKPMVTYLLGKNIKVSVATRTKTKADAFIGNHYLGRAIAWTMDDEKSLDKMIADHDLTVSLLPWGYHPVVAGYCLRHKKNMITTSYVKPEMKMLDKQAMEADIIILNELGLDPGIDHMSAMRIIDNVHNRNGKIDGFYSVCGALPSPEAAEKPFKYKFSWSPKGVIMAGNNEGKFLKDNRIIMVPSEDLFKNTLKIDFPGVGILEVYPNRDSLPYVNLYGIPETKTMIRGTFRYPGWCEIMNAMKQLRLMSSDKKDFSGKSFAEFMSIMISEDNTSKIKEKVAAHLGLEIGSLPVEAMDWLGLFEDRAMNRNIDSAFDIVSDLMIEKMMLGENESDMVAMQHIFLASWPDGKKEVIKSSMLEFGSPATSTSIARTVALPAAIGVEMILNKMIKAKGVHIPVIPEIYNPILDRLESMDIQMIEEYGLNENEFFKLM